MEINTTVLSKLVNQARDRDPRLLLAGLTVISKDASEYFALTGRGGAEIELFQDVFSDALSVQRDYFGSPLFLPLAKAGLPHGLTAAAAAGVPDLWQLSDEAIIHEWTVSPGRDLLKKFAVKFKETICGEEGPYEKFQNGLVGQADLPVVIAATILTAGLAVATFWYPLAVYLGLLLSKAALKTYCETGEIDLSI